ncbi:unnamed protein product [Prunus brigantina]
MLFKLANSLLPLGPPQVALAPHDRSFTETEMKILPLYSCVVQFQRTFLRSSRHSLHRRR